MEDSVGPNKAIVGLRWLVMLPAAVAGSLVVRFLVIVLNNISMTMAGVDPDSLLASLFIFTIGAVVFGAAFVYIGTYVAPAYERQVSVVLAGLVILLAGAGVFASLITNEWQSIVEVLLSVGGACGVAYERAVNDTPLNTMIGS